MRRIMALLLLMAALLAGAHAEDALYPASQSLMSQMQEWDILCLPDGRDADGTEWLVTEVSDSSGRTWEIRFGMDRDGTRCSLLAPGYISFWPGEMDAVLRVCNGLNAEYRYVRFYVDGLDEVTAAMQVRYMEGNPGAVIFEAYRVMMDVMVEGYERLGEFHLP